MASFYMDGPALSWYQWMFRNGLITSWRGLLQALESRFAPSFYDDPKGALFKLSQKGSVNEYLTEFERLANRIVGLPTEFLLSCFISGLSPEIRREVQALQPVTLSQATALAKLQEDKIEDRKRGYKGKGPFTPASSNTPKPNANPNPQSQTPTGFISNGSHRRKWPLAVKRASTTIAMTSGPIHTSAKDVFSFSSRRTTTAPTRMQFPLRLTYLRLKKRPKCTSVSMLSLAQVRTLPTPCVCLVLSTDRG